MSYQAIVATPSTSQAASTPPPVIGDSSGPVVKSCADFIIRNKNCFTLTGLGIYYVTAGLITLKGHYGNLACQSYKDCQLLPPDIGIICGDDPCPTAHANLAIGIIMIVLPIIGAAGVLLKAKYSR